MYKDEARNLTVDDGTGTPLEQNYISLPVGGRTKQRLSFCLGERKPAVP